MRELLDYLRAGASKAAFAKRVGISRRMLTALYAGTRYGGGRTLARFVAAFPSERERIWAEWSRRG